MKLLPPFGKSNPEIREGLRKYSASKYGRPRAIVEDEIRRRLSVNPGANLSQPQLHQTQTQQKNQVSWQERAFSGSANNASLNNSNNSIKKDSFLNDWLKKRDEIRNNNSNTNTQQNRTDVPLKSDLARTFQKNIMQNQSVSSYSANNSNNLNNLNNPQVQQNIKPQQIQNDSVIQDVRTSNNLSNRSSNIAKNDYKKVDDGEIIFKIR